MIARDSVAGFTRKWCPKERRFETAEAKKRRFVNRRSLKKASAAVIYLAMKFTYYGHACFSVEAGGKTLLFDPFITPNPLAKKIDVTRFRRTSSSFPTAMAITWLM